VDERQWIERNAAQVGRRLPIRPCVPHCWRRSAAANATGCDVLRRPAQLAGREARWRLVEEDEHEP
jgi:hypothetical protein